MLCKTLTTFSQAWTSAFKLNCDEPFPTIHIIKTRWRWQEQSCTIRGVISLHKPTLNKNNQFFKFHWIDSRLILSITTHQLIHLPFRDPAHMVLKDTNTIKVVIMVDLVEDVLWGNTHDSPPEQEKAMITDGSPPTWMREDNVNNQLSCWHEQTFQQFR